MKKPRDFTTLFLFYKKKTCAKRKTKGMFLVKVFTEKHLRKNASQ